MYNTSIKLIIHQRLVNNMSSILYANLTPNGAIKVEIGIIPINANQLINPIL